MHILNMAIVSYVTDLKNQKFRISWSTVLIDDKPPLNPYVVNIMQAALYAAPRAQSAEYSDTSVNYRMPWWRM